MKPPIIVGVVIVVLILGAGLLAPMFRSAEVKAELQARDEAELAIRLLHRHNYQIAPLARRLDPEDLKAADLPALLEKTQDSLEQLRQENARHLSRLQAQAKQDGMPAPRIELLPPTTGGLQQAAQHWTAALKANDELLKQAARHARAAATGVGANVLGVAQVAGAVEYTRAAALLDEAALLRRQQRWLQARLLLLAGQWRAYQAQEQYVAGLQMTTIRDQIEQHITELRATLAQATTEAHAMASQVAAREQELDRLEEQLRQARKDLLTLEQTGFTAGNDQSFQAYRDRYLALAEQLRSTEESEQLLRYGGYDGARFVGENLETAEIEGGEVVAGLEKLQAQSAAAQERAQRLRTAIDTLKQEVRIIEETDQAATQSKQRYADLLAQLDAEQEQIHTELSEAAKLAIAREDEALGAAQAAAIAFRTSQQAADRWQRAAREIQSARDTERKNPRLNMMVTDRAVPQIGSSAEAAALVLLGRIYAERIEATQALVDDMAILDSLRAEKPPFDPAILIEQIAAARQEALDQLGKAQEIYQNLAGRGGTTRWIPQTGLATVFHLLSRVQPEQAQAYLSSALVAVEEATQGREQSPYLANQTAFRDHLRAKVGPDAQRPAEGEAPTDEPSSPEDEPTDEG